MAKETHLEMLNARRPYFFEPFQPNSSSERLKIPFKFIKHLGGTTSGSVSLTGPSGKTWHVDLIQQNDSLYFHDGWPEFVRDHFIECGDALVFRYDGNFQFTVQVFDQSACEKEAAFHAECTQNSSNIDKSMRKKREREKEAASPDICFEGVPKKMRGSSSHLHLECLNKNREAEVDIPHKEGLQRESVITTEICKEATFFNKTDKCDSPSKTSTIPSGLKPCSERPETALKNRASKQDEQSSHARGCRSKYSISEEEKAALSFTSCFPYFVRIMKRFNVSGSYTLKVPYKFSMAHLPKCKIKVVLRNLKGECWTVNAVSTTRVHTSHTLCGGWIAFVRGNDIKIGDICIFELVRKCEMRVYILGDGKEGSNCQSGKTASNGFPTGCGPTSHKTFEGLPKKPKGKSSKVYSERTTNVNVSDKKRSKTHQEVSFSQEMKKHGGVLKISGNHALSSQSKACNDKSKTAIQNRNSVEEELGSKTRGCMSMMLALEEERVAQSFTSSFPNFVRIMKRFNISGSYTLKIPFQFSLAHLPDCKTEIALRNLKGECWTVNSVPDIKRRAMHTLCGGWMAFVRGNDIKMGDVCIFELVGKCEMRVHILGVGKKELDHQMGKAASNEQPIGSSTGNGPFL
ncbi:hypothetical protein L1049_026333 [Liquidambar formosana]|uniref:TF-B3 domain-containing protein n=1 Tax=Liquidambar formosana TaxID=63359 RepID=A0AAP0R6B8_LIQFO